ncbi:MAG: hypothetical protein BZY73_06160 [SAR202 cluster bacterium Casp-Chloro-G3]|nr:MAG: hypothetical protein BZY73_06160 [SAR202 cluster bacterium Casp-Chloro-G3]
MQTVFRRHLIQSQLSVSHNGRQHVIEVVGYTTGQESNTLQFLRLQELLFQLCVGPFAGFGLML